MAITQTVPILLIFCLGLVLKRVHILKREHAPFISQLIMTVILPATLISSLSTMEVPTKELLLPIAGLVIVTMLLGIGFVLAPVLGLRGTTRGAFLMAFPSLELGSIGYAFMLAVYGTSGLDQIVLLDLGNGFFCFTVVAFLANVLGQSAERFRFVGALKRFLKAPIIWAYGIGIALNMFHVQMEVFSDLLEYLAQGFLLLIMLLIALEYEWKRFSLLLPGLVTYLKLGIGVIVGVVVCLLFGFTGVTMVAVVLGAALPSSLLTVVFARENALDASFLASQLSLALPVAIGFSAVLIALTH